MRIAGNIIGEVVSASNDGKFQQNRDSDPGFESEFDHRVRVREVGRAGQR